MFHLYSFSDQDEELSWPFRERVLREPGYQPVMAVIVMFLLMAWIRIDSRRPPKSNSELSNADVTI